MSTEVQPTRVSRLPFVKNIDDYVARLTVMLLGLLILFIIVKPESFVSLETWTSMGYQFPEYGLMALGVMLTMITGGIDLSSVGVANMASITSASVLLSTAPEGADGTTALGGVLLAIGVALAIGALAGLFNGFLVAIVKIPSILVTLGTLELFTGIGIVISEGKPISGLNLIYSEAMGGSIAGLPTPFVIFMIMAIIIGFLLNKNAFGTKLYMLGTNPTAAKFSGLNSASLLIRTYIMSGLCASVAGLVMMANYNSAKADYGVAYTLLTVLIVVLGGVNPNGGSGRIVGVVLAILILQVLSSGLNLFPEISNFYRPLIWGGVLLLVISTNNVKTWQWRSLFSRTKELNDEVSEG